MCLEPAPGGLDDRVERVELRRPAEFVAEAFAARPELRRIARSAGTDLRRNGMARDATDRFENFLHRIAATDADVVDGAARRLQPIERQEMGVDQVLDMDIIADAGAVGRR